MIRQLIFWVSVSGALFAEDPNWDTLKHEVGGRLQRVESPFATCMVDSAGATCEKLFDQINDPFLLQSEPGFTESIGWLDAWTTAASDYAVLAESTEDVRRTVNFARENKLKLVIKGAGHSYQGRSCAPNSLLLWTRRMNRIQLHDAFIPEGAPKGTEGVHAVSADAGCIWAEVYTAVTAKAGRYAQGGGCPTVGVCGGFLQSGGFGSYSKWYGTAAASWLEAEVVTADGRVLIVNRYKHPELFWALKGGGGGTFGVVTRVTLETHELPEVFALVRGDVKAKSDAAYKRLLKQFVSFASERLLNPHWGEKVSASPDNTLSFGMRAIGKDEAAIESVWKPFLAWIRERPEDYSETISWVVTPAQKMWDYRYWTSIDPGRVEPNKGYDPEIYFEDLYFWEPAKHEAAAFWVSMQSRWIPSNLFKKERQEKLVDMLYRASREWGFEMQFNKGLAEATDAIRKRELETSMHPAALDASLLIISGAFQENVHPDIPGRQPDYEAARRDREKVRRAFQIMKEATAGSGSFATQSDYFQEDWQAEFWGAYYPKLLKIKKQYDPEGFFTVHHGVGSEL